MSATIVSRDGKPRLALGSPGSRRIISAVVQVVVNWVDGGLAIQEAVSASRMHVVPEQKEVRFERDPASPALLRSLERRGFKVVVPLASYATPGGNAYFGGVHAVALEPDGVRRGGADPRRDGAVRRTR